MRSQKPTRSTQIIWRESQEKLKISVGFRLIKQTLKLRILQGQRESRGRKTGFWKDKKLEVTVRKRGWRGSDNDAINGFYYPYHPPVHSGSRMKPKIVSHLRGEGKIRLRDADREKKPHVHDFSETPFF